MVILYPATLDALSSSMAGGLLRLALSIAAPYCHRRTNRIRLGRQCLVFAQSIKTHLGRFMGAHGLSDHIRITIGTMEENTRFIEVLKKLL